MVTITANSFTWRDWFSRLLFVPDSERNAGLPWLARYFLPIFVFGATRLVNILCFQYRGIDQLKTDAQGYIAKAAFIAAHGQPPASHDQLYRQFPGLSLLMIPVNRLFHDYTISGELITVLSALFCIVLTQHLFDDVRLTLLSTVFLPWTITTSINIASEWPTCLCLLIALWTLRDARRWSALFCLGILAAGFAPVLRPTAIFLILPLVGLWAWLEPDGGLRRALGVMAMAAVPFATLLAWNWLTIHDLFPEKTLQKDLLAEYHHLSAYPQYYSWELLNPPGRSLVGGLLDPSSKPVKKVLTIVILVIYAFALVRLVRLGLEAAKDDLNRRQALALAGCLASTFFFHLCVGGDFGFRTFGRYMVVVNLAVVVGLFYRRPLRWYWIVPLTLICLAYAVLAGGDNGFHAATAGHV